MLQYCHLVLKNYSRRKLIRYKKLNSQIDPLNVCTVQCANSAPFNWSAIALFIHPKMINELQQINKKATERMNRQPKRVTSFYQMYTCPNQNKLKNQTWNLTKRIRLLNWPQSANRWQADGTLTVFLNFISRNC